MSFGNIDIKNKFSTINANFANAVKSAPKVIAFTAPVAVAA